MYKTRWASDLVKYQLIVILISFVIYHTLLVSATVNQVDHIAIHRIDKSEYNVKLDKDDGCESKIRKTLQKIKGVDVVDIDMGLQKVTVTGYADQKKILKTVRRTGRRAEMWQLPYNPEMRNNNYTGHHSNYGGPSMYFSAAASGSSYNYYKHGCDNRNNYTYYGGSSTVFGNRAGDTFSDENPHGCAVM